MATSRWEELPLIINTLRKIDPKTVLDVGVGFGKIGLLIREYIEDIIGKTNPKQWELIINGIEIYQPYHTNSFQNIIYNNIYYMNAIDYFQNDYPYKYDLITCFDMIEHLNKQAGIKLLQQFQNTTIHKVLISIPLGDNWNYKYTGKNGHENHLATWNEEEINNLNYKTIKIYSVYPNRLMGIFQFTR